MSGSFQTLWQVTESGRKFGPYTADMLQKRISQGRFSQAALVWRDGFTGWEPIGSHFIVADTAPPTDSPIEIRSEAQSWRYAHWVSLAAMAALIAFLWADTSFLDDQLSPGAFLTVRLAAIGMLAVASGSAIFFWWRRSSNGTDPKAGIFRVAGVALSAIAVVVIFAALMMTPLLYRVQEGRISLQDYELYVDKKHGTLSIYGMIGPGLARKISQELHSNPAIKTVILESDGGLIQEAMFLVREFEARSLVTQVDDFCNSACILVFMSGRQRIAERHASFGFHAAGPVTPITGFYNLEAMKEQDAIATKYLLSRGVPAEFEQRAKELGVDELYPVSALRMVEAGAVTKLLDDGAPISLADAKKLEALESAKKGKARAAKP